MSWSQTFTINGKIVDELSNPIPFTNILLLQETDSTIVTGTVSDDNGWFAFSEINTGNYIIKATYISYEESFTTVQVNGNIDVGAIVLKEAVEALSEIELVYVKPTLRREPDRLVFNVEKTALSEGNMMDVLRSTPSVLVLNDAITVKGAPPTVYINDRKVHISTDEIVELLEGTSAANINAIEVITNPPARYDADSGVVINIKMNKTLVTGYNGSVFSSVTQGIFPKSNWATNHYFKGERVSFFVNYSYNDRKINREGTELINFPTNEWDTSDDRNTWSETHTASTNFDWDISENSTFSISSNLQFLPYFKRITRGKTIITPAQPTETGRFDTHNLTRDERHNVGLDVDFVQRFSGEGRLMFNAHYTNYDYLRKQNVSTNYFLGNNFFNFNNTFNTRSNQDTEILTSQLDYSQPVGEDGELEFGVKYSNVRSGSDIKQYDLIGGNYVLNTQNTDAFEYDETVLGAYASLSKNWEKWTLNLGLRVEDSSIEGISQSINQTNNQNYFKWFPTLSVGHNLSDSFAMFGGYKRSIIRPNYSRLNPFRYYVTDNSYVTGNPNLQPVFIDQFNLGFSINDTFIVDTYYKKYTNNIFELPIQDNVEASLAYTSINIDYTEEIGIDVEASFDLAERWSVYMATSLYNYRDRATLFNEDVERDMWSNYSILQNNWSFLKDNSLTAHFTMTYVGESVQGLQTIETTIFTDLSIRKTIFKGKGVLSLAVSDLLNRQNFTFSTRLFDINSPFYQNSTNYVNLDDRYVRLGFRYRFGNTNLSTNERSSSVDERDRLGNNH